MTNVVKLKAPPLKAKSPSSDDSKVIRACVSYAQSVAAASAGFKADPDGDSTYAGQAADRRYGEAKKALTFIGKTKARTAAGISAKARIVHLVINDDSAGVPDRFPSIEPVSVVFFRSFAADVKGFMDGVIEKEWKERHAAPRAVQS